MTIKDNIKNILGYVFIFASILIIIYVQFIYPKSSTVNQTYSVYTFLSSSWEKYKNQFINKDGRVIDYSQGSITTSEAQSYALLRSVWVGDKSTFDLSWNWTKDNLKRNGDHLFGWRWGKLPNGKYGFQSSSDQNTASDADSDIALSLILASRRWNDKKYLDQALPILNDIWKIDVATASGKNYLTAGNWAKSDQRIIINPSYFAPYAYRIFSFVDKEHDWNSLIGSSYDLLNKTKNATLDKKGVGIPPDWLSIDTKTGQLLPPNTDNLTTNYSYEAVRIPWRIGLDYQWNKSQAAKDYLTSAFDFLLEDYKKNGKLASIYSFDGSVVSAQENPITYATILGAFMVDNPDLAKKIYKEKVLTLYSNDTNSFNSNLSYYEQNWLWFGAALYNNQLRDF